MTPCDKNQLNNAEIVVYALYLKGGVSRPVHTEDVAKKAFELAPDRFSWIKYPEYPDKEVARIALTDARKAKVGALVSGRAGRGKGQVGRTGAERRSDGWQLTEPGIKWVTENEHKLSRELQEALPARYRQDLLSKMRRVRDHALFREFLDKPTGFAPTLGALAELLRCRVDADLPVWRQRLSSVKNLAVQADQQDMVEFLRNCEKFVKDGTG